MICIQLELENYIIQALFWSSGWKVPNHPMTRPLVCTTHCFGISLELHLAKVVEYCSSLHAERTSPPLPPEPSSSSPPVRQNYQDQMGFVSYAYIRFFKLICLFLKKCWALAFKHLTIDNAFKYEAFWRFSKWNWFPISGSFHRKAKEKFCRQQHWHTNWHSYGRTTSQPYEQWSGDYWSKPNGNTWKFKYGMTSITLPCSYLLLFGRDALVLSKDYWSTLKTKDWLMWIHSVWSEIYSKLCIWAGNSSP